MFFLPPANEVCEGYVSQSFCSQGVGVHGGGEGHAWQGGMHGGGGMHGREACMAWGHAWWGACMAGECAWQGGKHGREVCMAGACVVGGMHGRGNVWQGECVEGGHAWQGGMHAMHTPLAPRDTIG